MQPEKLYHIYNHANGSENLFIESENYRYFLKQWQKYIEPIAHTLAYSLMPNHFHFLIEIKQEEEIERTFGKFQTFQKLEYHISKQFANTFSSYTQAFNKKYQRKGNLFRSNFKKKEIVSSEYISNAIAYIHTNPIHHGFCQNLEQWPFSSYTTITSQKPSLIDKEKVLLWFGGNEAYTDFHNSYSQILYDKDDSFYST